MKVHLIGIAGTGMGSLAGLLKAAGHDVRGSDEHVYPPMSTQLSEQGIPVFEGFRPANLDWAPDRVVVGNVCRKDHVEVLAAGERGLKLDSFPSLLSELFLADRHSIVVAGTHGKTTTSSILAHVLHDAGRDPSFLIGGVPLNFRQSWRLGRGPEFVIEGDEYDTAFFDKGSKFLHYRPRTLVLNNLEYDHADIFPDLASIETQFHYLLRSVPGNGLVLVNGADANLARVLARGVWTPRQSFGAPAADWRAEGAAADGSAFHVLHDGKKVARVEWGLLGAHNVSNALAAMAAANHVGVTPAAAAAALGSFQGVKRRLEVRARVDGVTVYDDFAHHPTAVAATLAALRARVGRERILAVMEPRSATMKMGVHKDTLAASLESADRVFVYQAPNLGWDVTGAMRSLGSRASVVGDLDGLTDAVMKELQRGDHVLIMSNGGFGGFHDKLIDRLERRAAPRC